MNKVINYILCAFCLTVIMTACESYIAEPVSSQQISVENVKTVQDLDILITGAYSGIAREIAFSGNAVLIGELFGDLFSINNINYRNNPGRASRVYTWRHREEDYGLQAEFLQWSTFGLNNVNNVIELLRKTQVKTPDETDVRKNIDKQKGRLEGEARLVRALCIFEQTRFLGYPWGHTPDNATPGPIGSFKSLNGFPDLAYPRLSVRAAYDSVLNDLRIAERLLPEAYSASEHPVDFQPRGNKYAALGLMARVYWQQDNMDSCLAVLNRLLGSGTNYRFPLVPGNRMLADVFQRTGILPTTNSSNRNEVIFEMVHVVGRNPRTTASAPIRTHYVLQTPYSVAQLANVNTLNSGPNMRLSQWFKTLTNFDRTRDLRYRTLIDTTQAATANLAWNNPGRLWFPLKYGSRGTTNLGPINGVNNNIVVMRSAEFILMRAECNARKGNTAAAIEDLNAIKTRAGLPNITPKAEELLAEIRTEFVRETFGEGLRVHDLKRRKEAVNASDRSLSSNGEDCVLSNCQNVPWNSRLLIFLVPQTFLDRNPLAQQND